MYKYIISILVFIVFLVITVINLNGDNNISLNLILFKTPVIPGIIIFYIGIAIGTIIAMPLIVMQAKKKDSKVLNQHMKNETKRMKKQKKKTDDSTGMKGNINQSPPPQEGV